ncbi:Nitrite reductase, copper containing [Penicillium camemberti]|uniref:Copper-containing nitrite reductase n=1 Tax=Penicillium camemberti (strain FM 013) TaxID=1429867 RepID=A0A0G4PRQ9_PENC3|nr:Nitrite reductase, copper containing [Penicillium camemberti]
MNMSRMMSNFFPNLVVARQHRALSALRNKKLFHPSSYTPFPPPLLQAGIRQIRYISTGQPETRENNHAGYIPSRYFLAISASIVFSVLVYFRRQGTLRMDSAKTEQARGSDPILVPQANEASQLHSGPCDTSEERCKDISNLPKERAVLTSAPNVPPSITRNYPVLLDVPLTTSTKVKQLTSQYKYEQWNFNGTVPGPFIRARVGDVVEISLTNRDETGNPHNIDCHAIQGPGGGSALTTAEEGQTKTARFRLHWPGLYVYHCAAAPVPVHIANGMYGLMYVQPAEGDLAPVDREYYVMQSEFYHEAPEIEDDGKPSSIVEFSYPNAIREEPSVVVFNGHEAALTRDKPLKASVDESVRIFFGNAGPNLTSSFHVIGSNFQKVYRDGDVISPPGQFVPTVSVPPGGSTVVDLKMQVPGTYTLVDHAIFRLEKGAVGYLNVAGEPRTDIYHSEEAPAPCVGCKLHP